MKEMLGYGSGGILYHLWRERSRFQRTLYSNAVAIRKFESQEVNLNAFVLLLVIFYVRFALALRN